MDSATEKEGEKGFPRKSGDVKDAVLEHARDNELPCALAFDISKKLGVPPEDVGAMADVLGVRLSKCQMGLFGYRPEKKIVKVRQTDDATLTADIRQSLADGKLSCIDAWALAGRHNLSKLGISGVCEGMGIKISRCQLGAF